MARLTPEQLESLEIEDDDLVICVPRDPAHHVRRTRVFVGERPVGFLQAISLEVSTTRPAQIQAVFPAGLSPESTARLLASQALIAPWLDHPPQVPRPEGRSLWSRLDDEGDPT
jgi:hypothetical protein